MKLLLGPSRLRKTEYTRFSAGTKLL